jgi:hypothetical protein
MLEFMNHLNDSDLFEIDFHDDIIHTGKGARATLVYYNDHKVYIDFWEYSMPTYTMQVYDANPELIIKLQDREIEHKRFERICNRKNIMLNLTPEERQAYFDKIVPWTFFPSKMIAPLATEDLKYDWPIERVGFFCGKGWKCRGRMKRRLEALGIEFVLSNQGMRRGRPLNDNQYLKRMKTSKYGIVLHGRGSHVTDCKNRREIDYMILKKPLLMNYKPYYYNDLEPGKHFIYIDESTDIENLENDYNLEEIAENAYQWYLDNASPMGVAKSFLQIMQDKFPEDSKEGEA